VEDAKRTTERILNKWKTDNRQADVERLTSAIEVERNRDLVIELLWQGTGDLDLTVTEPSGSTCTATAKRTIGGGVLRSDILEQADDNRSESYTAAEAFSGKYTVNVKTALGRAIGNKATLKVTKYAGTDRQSFDVITLNLANPTPVEINLEQGSRTQLATLPTDDVAMVTRTTHESLVSAPTGVVAGFGGADAATQDAVNTSTSAKAVAPLVATSQEVHLPSASPSLPAMRLIGKVTPGSDYAEYTAKPVFVGKATDIVMPKVPLIPGDGK
jgi:hypothetical protein